MTNKEDKEIKYTPWATFIWAISILTGLFFVLVGVSMSAKSDSSTALQKIESEKEQQESNMIWIRESLTRIEKKIDTK